MGWQLDDPTDVWQWQYEFAPLTQKITSETTWSVSPADQSELPESG
jgi:hypothetical protein